MFSVFRVFAFFICSILMVPAHAGTQSGTITGLVNRTSDGLLFFYLSGPASGKASCATAPYWVIKDENSNTGKRLLAMLLTAKVTGQSIYVTGAGACTRWVDGEDVDSISL
jgi:hypothetical protein